MTPFRGYMVLVTERLMILPVLPDILRPGLRLIVCGTAAGRAWAARKAYYAGRGNRFWEVIHRVGLTPELLSPEDCPTLLQYGIGQCHSLTSDVCSFAQRVGYSRMMGRGPVWNAALPQRICVH